MPKILVYFLAAAMAFGCSWDYDIWIPRTSTADPLYRFVKDGNAGYIDAKGHVMIPPSLETYGNYGGEFHDGLLSLSHGKYVDRNGKLVIDKGLNVGWDFSEGLAVASRKDERLLGYINTKGEFAISPRFRSSASDYVSSFSDGLAKIEVNGKFGFIDHSGEFVIPPELPDASDFHDGMARIVAEGPCSYLPDGPCASSRRVGSPGPSSGLCKFTYIDKAGTVITKARFDAARDFSEGFAPVRIGDVWGFIDKTGSIVIPPQFGDAKGFHSGLAAVSIGDGLGYIDKTGKIVVPPQFESADDFSEGLAVVGDGETYWYIDQQGRTAIQGNFAAASPFFKGLAQVRLDAADDPDALAYIDHSGHRVFTY